MNVTGRRGWNLGSPVISGGETRAALTHIETKYVEWVYGDTPEQRQEAAREAIDRIYEAKWISMMELIAEGDRRGPNVKPLIS